MKKAFDSGVQSSLENFFDTGITGAAGLGDAFRQLALGIVDSLRKVASQILATALTQKLLSSLGGSFGNTQGGGQQVATAAAAGTAQAAPLVAAGTLLTTAGATLTTAAGVLGGASGGMLAGAGAVSIAAIQLQAAADTMLIANSAGGFLGFADGGLISGPGSGTSDSIPARVSNGEFVMRAAAVRQPGVLPLLSMMNRGMGAPFLRGRSIPHFATGGLVSAADAMQGGGGRSEVHIGIEEGTFVKRVHHAMTSKDGQEVTIKTLSKQPKRAQQALGRQ